MSAIPEHDLADLRRKCIDAGTGTGRHSTSVSDATVPVNARTLRFLIDGYAEHVTSAARLVEEEVSHARTIEHRDVAEEAINRLFRAVMGRSPEWSHTFGFSDAIREVEEREAKK